VNDDKTSTRLAWLLLWISAAISGCATAPHVEASREPPPRTTAAPEAPLSNDGWIQEDAFYRKIVHYGTTRVSECDTEAQPANSGPANPDCRGRSYPLNSGNDRTAPAITYGTAIVEIPFEKKVGGTQGMSLVGVDHDIGWEKFLSGLSEQDLLVFVHGYNTSFASAAIRCAQLAHDTNFKGEAVFYSWPSEEGIFDSSYRKDKARARENFGLLANFLQDLAANTDRKIHVVAHSMGTYILMNSLANLDDRVSKNPDILASRRAGNKGKIFNQVILAAPDIATDEYREEFALHKFPAMAENITLYSAVNDHVLGVSRIVNVFVEGTAQARLGDSSGALFVLDGMDTVDTRQEIDPQFFGHSFYANYRSLVADMYLLLNYGTRPDDRMLQGVSDEQGHHLWFIRD